MPKLGGTARGSSLQLGASSSTSFRWEGYTLGEERGVRLTSARALTSLSGGVPLVVGLPGQVAVPLSTCRAWLVRSGCGRQHHGTVHHSGSGLDSMVSFISGPHSGGGSSAVHCQDMEIVYTDRRDVAAMCCLLQIRLDYPCFDLVHPRTIKKF